MGHKRCDASTRTMRRTKLLHPIRGHSPHPQFVGARPQTNVRLGEKQTVTGPDTSVVARNPIPLSTFSRAREAPRECRLSTSESYIDNRNSCALKLSRSIIAL